MIHILILCGDISVINLNEVLVFILYILWVSALFLIAQNKTYLYVYIVNK